MARRRGRKQPDEEVSVEAGGLTDDPDVRQTGPWDAADRSVANDPDYVDLGALRIRGREGLTLQLPADADTGEIGSVVIMSDDAALELRAFAATRSGGLWDEVRDDLIIEVERLGGQCEQVEGLFGAELRVSVPVELPDGEAGFQPSRIVGIEGPRWLLRATFLGNAGLHPSDEGILIEALRDVVVVRGQEARIPREALLLTVPDGAVPQTDEE